jgi:hypothetical protein
VGSEAPRRLDDGLREVVEGPVQRLDVARGDEQDDLIGARLSKGSSGPESARMGMRPSAA